MAALRLLGAQWKVSVCSKRSYPKGTLGCRRFLLHILDWATPWHTRMSHDNSSYIIIKKIYYILLYNNWIYLDIFGIFIFFLPFCHVVPPLPQKGVRRVCDSPLFNALHSAELELIVCGEQDLDFAQLRKNAHYDGYQATRMIPDATWVVDGRRLFCCLLRPW